ncbi:MAG: DUF2179 domain-containing protein [Bacteroidales bacterium]|nr:DUF2179 domain-containing protein [Bacteroidales bacterium]
MSLLIEMSGMPATSPWFTWVVIPLLIFFARVADVSIGTLRLIFVSKGLKLLAPVLGFFEVIIWLLAISQIMQHLDNVICYLAYGLGFATGNYIGIYIDEKMSLGTVLIRVFPKKEADMLVENLRSVGYGVTATIVEGMSGSQKMLFSIVKRKDVKDFIGVVNAFNPATFYTIEDIRTAREGYFREGRQHSPFTHLSLLRRKGK